MLNWRKVLSLPLPILLLSVAALTFAQSTRELQVNHRPVVRFINPTTIHKPMGYSHVVEVAGGRMIYLAGQIPLDRSGNVVGRGDFRAQTQQAFENMKAALETSRASFKDVIKLNNYLVDISQLKVFTEVRDKYVNTSHPPASTTVEVRRLYREEILIEIEAVAVVPE